MSTAITKALDEIKFNIPPQILQIAFKDDFQNWRQAPVSIDDRILSKIIKPRVLVDCNLIGGTLVTISLEGVNPKYRDQAVIVYEIPPNLIDNREIISILSVGYVYFNMSVNGFGSGFGGILNSNCGNDLLQGAQKVLDSYSSIPNLSNANVDLVGYNTVVIRDQIRTIGAYQLRCMLANENNLNNISPRSYRAFSKLCVLAVKSYIYNTLLVTLDQAYLAGGQDLGAVRTYVEGLNDVEEQYQTYLREVMAKTLFMNDTVSHKRFLQNMVNIGV